MVLEAVVEKLRSRLGQKVAFADEAVSAEQLDDCLERVVQWVAGRFGKEYFVEPLEEFAVVFGKSFPEDPFFQDRMNYFLEYSVLEKPLKGNAAGLTPLRMFMDELVGREELFPEPWRIFSEFRHSIFEVVRSGEQQILLKDLFNERRYIVRSKAGETLKYLTKKTIFQAYLFGSTGAFYLGQGVVIHPERARKPLKKFIKIKTKANVLKEMDTLKLAALVNMRYLRMKHVDPSTLYSQYLV